MSFSQLKSIILAHKLIATWVFVSTVLVTTLISILIPKNYTATTSLIINAKGADPITGVMLPATLMPGYIATQSDIIESKSVALRVVKMLGLANNPTAKQKFVEATDGKGDISEWFAEQFIDNLTVKPSRESSLIDISYTWSDPDFAATIANTFAKAYIETNLQLKTDPSKEAAVFFDKQIKGLRENVEKAQAKLSQYQKENGITATEDRLDVETARLSELSTQLVMAQAQTYDSTSRRTQLNRGGSSDSPEILGNSLIQGLKSQLVQAEARLSEVSQHLGENHPQYQAAQQDVNNLRESILRETAKTSGSVGQTAKVSQLREGEIRAALAAQKERVLKLKGLQDEMSVLMREADSAQKVYDNALLRFSQSNMEGQSGQTDVSVLNPATPPVKHSSPKIKLNIFLSMLAGALLAVIFSLIAEMLDRRVRSTEDMSRGLGMSVLADLTKQENFNLIAIVKSFMTKKNHKKLATSNYRF